jgi:hypothetical protein
MTDPCVAEPVVTRAGLRVGKNLIGLGGLFEKFFGVLIFGIAIRMQF